MNDISNLADHAAAQSDRWLLMVLIIIGLLAVIVLWRWLVADREKTAQRLTNITDRHIQQTEHLSVVVANNTAALQEVRSVLGNCQAQRETNYRKVGA